LKVKQFVTAVNVIFILLCQPLNTSADQLFQESFETDGEGSRYISNHFYMSTSDYFERAIKTALGTYSLGDSGTWGDAAELASIDGNGFWVGDDVTSNGAAGDVTTKNNITITDYTGLQVIVALADTRYPVLRVEAEDGILIQYSLDGGAYTTCGAFYGDHIDSNLGQWRLDSDLDGTSTDMDSGIILSNLLTDYTFNIPGTGDSLKIKILVNQSDGYEEICFDNIRVTGDVALSASPTIADIETTKVDYTEGAAPVVLTSTLTTGDVDDANLESAIIQITGNFHSDQDVLAFSNTASITGSYSNGIMTLSGSATLAAYQSALRSVTYSNSNVLNPSEDIRTISFYVNDGDSNSNVLTRDVIVRDVLTGGGSIPYSESFETEGDGVRYASNTFYSAPYDYSYRVTGGLPAGFHTTVTGYDESFVWAVETAVSAQNPLGAGNSAYIRLVNLDVSVYSDLQVIIGLADGSEPLRWDDADYVKIQYAFDGDIDPDGSVGTGNYATVGAFYGNSPDQVGDDGQLAEDGDLDGAADIAGAEVTAAFQDFSYSIHIPAGKTNISIRIEVTNDNNEELAIDHVRIAVLNDDPAVSVADLSITEGQAAVQLDSSAIASDGDGDSEWDSGASLKVQVTADAEVSDEINIDTSGDFSISAPNISSAGTGIIGTISETSGTNNDGVVAANALLTINFNSNATNAIVQDLVRSIRYANTSNDPTGSSPTRTVTFTLEDKKGGTGSDTSTITITPVNDEPTLVATGSSPTFSEGGVAASLFTSASISTVESGQNISQLIFTVSESSDGATETVTIDGTSVALIDSTSGTTSANSFAYSVVVSGATATVTITKSDTPANYQTLIDNLAYANSSESPTANSSRIATITTIKDSGGTANSGDDTAMVSIASTITVIATNDDPAMANLPTDIAVLEDTASNVDFSAATFSDVDSAANTIVLTIAASVGPLTSNSSGGVVVGGSGSGTITLSGTATALDTFLNTAGNIQYTGASNVSGNNSSTLTLTANDGGNTGSGGGENVNLGIVNVDITAVNDDPAIASLPADISVTEDTASNVDLSAATFSDVDSAANTIVLTIAADAGTLTTSSSGAVSVGGSGSGAITLSGTVAAIDTFLNTAGNIQYTGASNASGDNSSTLILTANDGGNTGIGGGTNVVLGIVNVDIIAENDAPDVDLDGSTGAITFATTFSAGGSAVTIAKVDAIVADADTGDQIESLTATLTTRPNGDSEEKLSLTPATATTAADAGLTVTYTPATGVLSITGTDSSTTYQAILRGIQYQNSIAPASATPGARTIDVVANDGEDNSITATATVTVVTIPIIDLDGSTAGTGFAVTFIEDGGAVVIVDNDATLTDSDSTNLNQLIVEATNAQSDDSIKIGTRNNGDTVNGIVITEDSSSRISLIGSATKAMYLSLIQEATFIDNSQNPDTTTRTITFQGRDTDGYTGPTSTSSVTVQAQNDAPTLDNVIADQIFAGGGGSQSCQFPANTFSDIDGDTLIYSATLADDSSLPTWLSLDSANRTFTGIPAASDRGTYGVKVTADDGHSGTITGTFNLQVSGTLTVLNTNDSGAGSLRQAITDAYNNDTLDLTGLNGTITLGGTELSIDKNLSLVGPATGGLTISGDNSSRVINIHSGTVYLKNLTIENGAATTGNGAGILNSGILIISNSTIRGNNANGSNNGGGLYNDDTAILKNVTLSGNSAYEGGAIFNNSACTLTLNNITISHNTAITGGGINNAGTLHITNTIVANSMGGDDCIDTGSILTNSNNLIEDNTCSPALFGDPLLAAMDDNGGSTWTHLPKSSISPVVDAGDNATCESTDQRSKSRPVDGNKDGTATCDIGSVEYSKTAFPWMLWMNSIIQRPDNRKGNSSK
jgi:Putative Ig domain